MYVIILIIMYRSEINSILGNSNRRQHKAHFEPVQLAGQHTDKRYLVKEVSVPNGIACGMDIITTSC